MRKLNVKKIRNQKGGISVCSARSDRERNSHSRNVIDKLRTSGRRKRTTRPYTAIPARPNFELSLNVDMGQSGTNSSDRSSNQNKRIVKKKNNTNKLNLRTESRSKSSKKKTRRKLETSLRPLDQSKKYNRVGTPQSRKSPYICNRGAPRRRIHTSQDKTSSSKRIKNHMISKDKNQSLANILTINQEDSDTSDEESQSFGNNINTVSTDIQASASDRPQIRLPSSDRPHTSSGINLADYKFGTFKNFEIEQKKRRVKSAPLVRGKSKRKESQDDEDRPPTRQRPPPEALHLELPLRTGTRPSTKYKKLGGSHNGTQRPFSAYR